MSAEHVNMTKSHEVRRPQDIDISVLPAAVHLIDIKESGPEVSGFFDDNSRFIKKIYGFRYDDGCQSGPSNSSYGIILSTEIHAAFGITDTVIRGHGPMPQLNYLRSLRDMLTIEENSVGLNNATLRFDNSLEPKVTDAIAVRMAALVGGWALASSQQPDWGLVFQDWFISNYRHAAAPDSNFVIKSLKNSPDDSDYWMAQGFFDDTSIQGWESYDQEYENENSIVELEFRAPLHNSAALPNVSNDYILETMATVVMQTYNTK
jgi:hypothetical protein